MSTASEQYISENRNLFIERGRERERQGMRERERERGREREGERERERERGVCNRLGVYG